MLTKLIVDLYVWIIEIFLWFVLLVSGVAGFLGTVPILKSAGRIPESETSWMIFGAVFFPVATFLLLVVLMGPFLVLVDIRRSVRAFESTNFGSGGSHGIQPVEHRELHL